MAKGSTGVSMGGTIIYTRLKNKASKPDNYSLTRSEKKAIKAHNKAVDAANEVARGEDPPVVTLQQIRKVCEASYLTVDHLKKCKDKMRFGNGKYEIKFVSDDPLTIKIKKLNGSFKTYIVKE